MRQKGDDGQTPPRGVSWERASLLATAKIWLKTPQQPDFRSGCSDWLCVAYSLRLDLRKIALRWAIAYPVQGASRVLMQVFRRRLVRHQQSILIHSWTAYPRFSGSVQLVYPRRGYTAGFHLSTLLMDVLLGLFYL